MNKKMIVCVTATALMFGFSFIMLDSSILANAASDGVESVTMPDIDSLPEPDTMYENVSITAEAKESGVESVYLVCPDGETIELDESYAGKDPESPDYILVSEYKNGMVFESDSSEWPNGIEPGTENDNPISAEESGVVRVYMIGPDGEITELDESYAETTPQEPGTTIVTEYGNGVSTKSYVNAEN